MLHRILAVAFVCFATPLFAETILYVKPGATGSGANWDDAADLATAVAAAKEKTPCAIYVAKGVYAASKLAVAPGTSLYGGFAGESMDETVSGRDCAANKTVVYGNKSAVWTDRSGAKVVRDGANVRVMNDDGTFNEPDPTDAELYWIPSAGEGVFDTSSDTRTGSDVSSVVVDGFAFTTAYLRFSGIPATVRNCRFFGCGTVGGVGVVWGCESLAVEDTAFDWCRGPAVSTDCWGGVDHKDRHVAKTAVLRNVSVRHQVADSHRGLGVYATHFNLTVDGCAFERNYNLRNLDDGGPSVIYGNDSATFSILNTRFVGNHISSNANALVVLPNYKSSVVSNCLFLANRIDGDRGAASSAATAILNARRNDHLIDACSFVSNVVDRWEAATKSGVTTLPCSIVYSCYVAPIRHCTFDGNRVSAVAASASVTPIRATLYSEGGNDNGCLFGNTFNGNDVATGEIVLNRRGGGFNMFNSIFWNTSDSYVPVARLDDASTVTYRHCVVKNLPEDADWIVNSEAVYADDPQLADELTAVGNLLVRRPGAGAASSARRKGIPLYYDSSEPRKVAYFHGRSYIRCDTLGTSLLNAPYTAIPDALGQFAREGQNPDIGAVQAAASGLLLILR